MIANLISKQDYYICSHCRMRQPEIHPYCYFCDATFSNYEDVVLLISFLQHKIQIESGK